MTNQDTQFYPLLGPYLSRREIVRETGNPIWDDPGKVWFVAVKDRRVLGFVAAAPQKTGAVICGSDYIRPEYREQGLYAHLSTARTAWLDEHGHEATATVLPAAAPVYEAHGFTSAGSRGKYTRYVREARRGQH